MIKIGIWILILIVVVLAIEFAYIYMLQLRAKEVIASSERYTQEGSGVRILIAGDSTGYGTGARDAKDSVAGRLGQKFPDATIHNISENGYVLREVAESLPESTYDIVVLQAGGNDILNLHSGKQMREDALALLSGAKEIGREVYFMSTGDVGNAPGLGPIASTVLSQRTRVAHGIFTQVSTETGVTFIDLYQGEANVLFVQDPKRYHSDDNLHPSGEGYGVWFEALVKEMK